MRNFVKLPLKISPIDLCDVGADFEGVLPLANMRRLSELLADTSGQVHVRFHFGKLNSGKRYIKALINGKLLFECQRCGNPVSYDIKSEIKLCPIFGKAMTDELPEDLEPLLVNDEQIILSELVEEELLLSLPMVPKHAFGECSVKLPDNF